MAFRSLSAQHAFHFGVVCVDFHNQISAPLSDGILRAVVDPPERAALDVLRDGDEALRHSAAKLACATVRGGEDGASETANSSAMSSFVSVMFM